MSSNAARPHLGRLAGMGPVVVLELRRERNRLRRLLRRPGWLLFYLAVAVGVLVVVMRLPAGPGTVPEGGTFVSGGLAALWVLLSLGQRARMATQRPPFTLSAADACLLLPSPISSRHLVVFHLVKAALTRLATQLPFLLLWVVLLERAGVPLGRSGAGWIYAFILLTGLWGDGLHAVTWLALERQAPPRAAGARGALRAGLGAAAGVGGVWLLAPVLKALAAGTLPGAGVLVGAVVERAYLLASVPPMSWAAGLLAAAFGHGSDVGLLPVAGVGVLAVLWAAAWGLAEGYYEPLVLQGEQDARIHQAASAWSADSQITALEQLGLASRVRRLRALPPLGGGAWALFWQQANRWLRLELAVWWMSLLILAGAGVLLGAVVRAGVPSLWLWVVPPTLALFSAPWGYLSEELRRPYLYLIPDAVWKRLVAASLVSSVDLFFSYGAMLLVAAGVARVGPATAGIGLLVLLGVGWVSQAALALASIGVPAWLGRGTRVGIQTGLALVGLTPAGTGAWAVLSLGASPLGAAAAGLVLSLAAGAGLFAAAAGLFHRAELAE